MIRYISREDRPALMALARLTALFDDAELSWLDEQIGAYLDGTFHQDLRWILDEDEQGALLAAAHYGVDGIYEPALLSAPGQAWNLYFLGVHPDARGRGTGRALLLHVEQEARAAARRALIIETSSAAAQQPARALYAANGYIEHERVLHAYGDGEHKLILLKML